MRVVRIYHGGRDPAHRKRNEALMSAGVEVILVVPTVWPDSGSEELLRSTPYKIVEVPVRRPGDVNRHSYRDVRRLRQVITTISPDLVDIHEEPVSVAMRQALAAAGGLPCVGYTAQNVDKRFPPPFAQYEQAALAQLAGLYPCSRQAASVARGKGFSGAIDVLPLGYDESAYFAAAPRPADADFVLGLVGRLVPEKGVLDAVEVLSRVRRARPTRLVIVGTGPEEARARRRAAELGVSEALEIRPWQSMEEMAALYRTMHVVLLPSVATQTWVEQFGRVIIEAQASGAVLAGYASGTIPEVAGPAGLLVPEADMSALGAAVTQLAKDPAELMRRRELGLQNAAPMTWTQVGRRQADFYARALDAARRPRRSAKASASSREAACAEFGPPARVRGGAARPFGAPLLRSDMLWTRRLGQAIDAGSHAADRVRRAVGRRSSS